MAPSGGDRPLSANAFWMIQCCFSERRGRRKRRRAPAADLMRDLETVTAIVNRAHRRLAGANAAELDRQQRAAARKQIERIEKQLQRIDEKLLPEQNGLSCGEYGCISGVGK